MNLLSKRRFLILAVITSILIISGCGGPSRQEVLEYLAPSGNEKYAIHLFYRGSLPMTDTDELNVFMSSNPPIQDAINRVQFWASDHDPHVKWAKVLAIKDFPMYLVMDTEGIVFETPYLSRLKEFLTEELVQGTNSE